MPLSMGEFGVEVRAAMTALTEHLAGEVHQRSTGVSE
jgi:hypothetical protein